MPTVQEAWEIKRARRWLDDHLHAESEKDEMPWSLGKLLAAVRAEGMEEAAKIIEDIDDLESSVHAATIRAAIEE